MPLPPRTPRTPLCELSPNTRSRVVLAHDYGIKICDIARQENLLPSTCRFIFKNASNQASCKSQPRSGRPSIITIRDGKRLFRAIATNPKITATQLRAGVMPNVSKNTITRYLQKSGIQKWRCRKRPLLNDTKAAARLQWALLHNNKSDAYWRR